MRPASTLITRYCASTRLLSSLSRITPPAVVEFGLAEGAFVSLSLGIGVPASVAADVAQVAEALRQGQITIPHRYDGPEFLPKDTQCLTGG